MKLKSFLLVAVVVALFTQIAVGQDRTMIPADAQGVGRVNLKELNANAVYKKFRSQAEGSDFIKNFKTLRVDEKSITKILLYTREKGERTACIFLGTFDNAQIQKDLAANAVQSNGYKAYKITAANGTTGYMAFPKAGMFIVSEKISELKYLSSVLDGSLPALQPKSRFDNALRNSAVMVFAGEKGMFGPDDEGSPEFFVATLVPQGPSALKALVAMAFADAATPVQYEQQANGMKAMFTMMAMQDEYARNSGIPELLQAVNIKSGGKNLNSSLVINEKMANAIANLIKDDSFLGGGMIKTGIGE